MSASPGLELRNVHKRYGGVPAVCDASLALAEGEFLSLLGPSGCGKSTTLSLIAGFESADAGDILVHGRSVVDLAPGKRGVGIVFQDFAVFDRLSVRENLGFGLHARGTSGGGRARQVEEMAARLDLTALLDRRGRQLNVSELQRVALGRSLLTRPGLLLLDEPMANLDSALRERLRGELKSIQTSLQQTVLYVTHDQVEALALSDHIAVMNEGRIVQIGTPSEVYHHPRTRFVAEFIGDPPINLLPCTVRNEGGMAVARTAQHHLLELGATAAREGEYLLGIRPEHVALSRPAAPDHANGTVRFVENLGAEHVAHVEYGDQLVRALTVPGAAAPDEHVHLRFDLNHALLIDTRSGDIVAVERARQAQAA